MTMKGRVLLGAMLTVMAVRGSAAEQPGDAPAGKPGQGLEWIRVSGDKTHFVGQASGRRIVIWGVNYDHDEQGRLIEDYWHPEWAKVAADFAEIKALGGNVIRV
nr:hypothetical protein [Pirellulaceae bacterium]